MSWALRNTAEYLSSGVVITLNRDEGIPVEWRSLGFTVARDERIPLEWLQALARLESSPVEWTSPTKFVTRDDRIPVEWTGGAPNTLLLIWRVLNKYSTTLTLQWAIVSGALNQSLLLQWNVKAPLLPLTLRWNVLPAIISFAGGPGGPAGAPGAPSGPGSQDLQQPTSIQQKTP